MRRRTGNRARAMFDPDRWCKTRGCRLPLIHSEPCYVSTQQQESTDYSDPQAVVAELRRRDLPVHRAGDVIGTDVRLRELFTLARLGGWTPDIAPRPRYINLGRLRADDTRREGQGG